MSASVSVFAAPARARDADPRPAPPPQLRNKAPRWHDAYQCWCLDFGGRVTQASVKNFQLVAQGSSRVLMQFGRTSHKDIFVMDYEVRPTARTYPCVSHRLTRPARACARSTR